MRGSRVLISFVVLLCFLTIGCDQATSQSRNISKKTTNCSRKRAKNAPKTYDDFEIVGETKNTKYSFNLIVTARNDEFNKGFDISFWKSGEKKCLLYKTSSFDPGINSKNFKFFSPDEELVVLPCGADSPGYCIYDMKKVAEYFNDRDNFREGKTSGNYCEGGMDTFKTPIEISDSVGVFNLKDEEFFPQKFGGWKSDTEFVFHVQTDSSNNWQEFIYNAKAREIYGEKLADSAIVKNADGKIDITSNE